MARGSITIICGEDCIFRIFIDHLMCDTDKVRQRFDDHFEKHKADMTAFMKFLMQFEFSNSRGPFVDYEMEISV
jgi:hypothetical protein